MIHGTRVNAAPRPGGRPPLGVLTFPLGRPLKSDSPTSDDPTQATPPRGEGEDARSQTSPTRPARRVGPYVIEALLGRGGMGEVWRARDTRLDRLVALKTITGAVAQDADGLPRFRSEARLLARLNHPHVATVFDLPEVDGQPALVMELLDGEELASRLRRGPLAVEETLKLGVQVRVRITTAIVIFNYLLDGRNAPVVHIGGRPGDLAQRGRLKRPAIFRLSRYHKAS